MLWWPDIVEFVRRSARELFQHKSFIGNFSGKYFVSNRELSRFCLEIQAGGRSKTRWPGIGPAI
jgi:hypothetical protein